MAPKEIAPEPRPGKSNVRTLTDTTTKLHGLFGLDLADPGARRREELRRDCFLVVSAVLKNHES
jgi:hypothetical protein